MTWQLIALACEPIAGGSVAGALAIVRYRKARATAAMLLVATDLDR